MQIFIHRDNQEFGPYSLDQIKAFLADGSVTGEDYCRVDADTEWNTVATRLGKVVPPRLLVIPSVALPPRAAQEITPAIPVPTASQPPAVVLEKKKMGCFKVGGFGCLGVIGVIVLYFFALVTGIVQQPKDDPDISRGYDEGNKQGALMYTPGGLKPSDEETSAYARQLLSSPEFKDYAGDQQKFIQGYETGFSVAWDRAKSSYVNGQ